MSNLLAKDFLDSCPVHLSSWEDTSSGSAHTCDSSVQGCKTYKINLTCTGMHMHVSTCSTICHIYFGNIQTHCSGWEESPKYHVPTFVCIFSLHEAKWIRLFLTFISVIENILKSDWYSFTNQSEWSVGRYRPWKWWRQDKNMSEESYLTF